MPAYERRGARQSYGYSTPVHSRLSVPLGVPGVCGGNYVHQWTQGSRIAHKKLSPHYRGLLVTIYAHQRRETALAVGCASAGRTRPETRNDWRDQSPLCTNEILSSRVRKGKISLVITTTKRPPPHPTPFGTWLNTQNPVCQGGLESHPVCPPQRRHSGPYWIARHSPLWGLSRVWAHVSASCNPACCQNCSV